MNVNLARWHTHQDIGETRIQFPKIQRQPRFHQLPVDHQSHSEKEIYIFLIEK